MASEEWQPTTFLRFERHHATSIGTARIVTDAGPAYIKPLGNAQGPHVLACEWVATQLAKWFGLPTFDFAIMDVLDVDEIPLGNNDQAAPGPAFVSRATLGHTWGGSSKELERLVNPEAITRLVVFDTWCLNCDRHHPDRAARQPNLDNVFLSDENVEPGELRLIAMDHTHCFTCGRDLTPRLADIGRVRDTNLYGLFKPFEARVTRAEVDRSVQRLREISRLEARSMIDTIPREWEVESGARDALEQFICGRAQFVAETMGVTLEPYFSHTQMPLDL